MAPWVPSLDGEGWISTLVQPVSTGTGLWWPGGSIATSLPFSPPSQNPWALFLPPAFPPVQATWQSHSHSSTGVSFCRSICLLSVTSPCDSTASSLQISSLPWGNSNCPRPQRPLGSGPGRFQSQPVAPVSSSPSQAAGEAPGLPACHSSSFSSLSLVLLREEKDNDFQHIKHVAVKCQRDLTSRSPRPLHHM